MRDVLVDVTRWQAAGEPVALATVVSVQGSAPRGVGATLAISASGEISGSVSGGCVEPAVIEEGLRAIRTGRPTLLQFGITEAQNVEQIGLSCGGEIRVFVERLGDIRPLREALMAEHPIARALALESTTASASILVPETGSPTGTLGDATLDQTAIASARGRLAHGESGTERLATSVGAAAEIFFAVFPAPPSLVVIGAGHIAIPLTQIAKVLGYHVTVVDAREAFATRERFPDADELLVEWPDEALAHLPLTGTTAVAVLTHDAKFDEPALRAAVNSPAGYVGAIGSRGTKRDRDVRLLAQGVTDEQIARIHGPIGLDIGARTPEEIALAIMAQIVASRHQRPAQ
ncbi:MAG TPA: XdhC/CoxI family protein [Ktedonobacterales bacterium]|jgi:xanthine dehydrogenase accessory factor|nr:XdhC/CoxI family protein [Ktedonobacterales bacterium]